MIFFIEFHPEAQKEFVEAAVWYEEQQIGLGTRFSVSINNKLQHILDTPLIYPKTQRDFREAVIEDFPYIVVFKISSGEKIYISSIFHTSRNPKKKYRNLV